MDTVFVDMDGVLVDFVGGVLKHHKLPGTTVDRFKGSYAIETILDMTPAEFWTHLDENRKFWADLSPTRECFQIIESLERQFGKQHVYLLSSPAMSPDCYSGKAEWVAKHLPRYMSRLFLMGKKHFCAARGRLLVDDSDANVDMFRRFGGSAVLYPRPWNSLHSFTHDGMKLFTREIQRL